MSSALARLPACVVGAAVGGPRAEPAPPEMEDAVEEWAQSLWQASDLEPRVRLRVTSRYGWRTHPVTGDRQFHSGVDLSMPTGTPIHALWTGRLSVMRNEISGLTAHVTTGQFRVSYLHLSTIEAEEGDIVTWADRFALSGATGRVTGPHLHLQVQVDYKGKPYLIDPEILYPTGTFQRG